jgi:CTP synthase
MNTKYIFVTGGVVSSLGKGIISASIGKLLQARGFKVTIQKFDPYINIDPGTLNPYEHGECYVTEDGFETDLDLGHYERFTGIHTTRNNSITTGRIYKTVIDRERHGDYLGKTIQVVPHITDEIKRRMLREGLDEGLDFVITEVGGTIGDIESAPFMEAIRQLRWQLGHDAVCVHLTYVPYLKAADELKTKPTQHSVKELQGMGIQPDILVLRTERHLDDHVRIKVASFCNVDLECVVQSEDMPSIYEVPVSMQKQGLDAAIMRKIGIPVGERRRERLRVGELRSGMGELCSGMGDGTSGMTPAMKPWHDFLDKQRNAKREIHIGLVGKYNLQDAYKSIRESLNLAGIYNDVKARLHFINSEEITSQNIAERLRVGDGTSGMKLADMAGIVICPGFGQRGIEGKIIAAEYTRSHDIPTFGICLGMQMMVIEFARNVLGYKDANSREMDEQTPHNVIDIMEEQKSITQMGGTMRLGAYECELREGSKAAQAYSSLFTLHSSLTIKERHRHRYEFNNTYKEEYEAKGMKCVGINPAADLVEIVEIPDKRWYIGTQFHPEYSSTVLHPHPLFMSFIKECAQENP